MIILICDSGFCQNRGLSSKRRIKISRTRTTYLGPMADLSGNLNHIDPTGGPIGFGTGLPSSTHAAPRGSEPWIQAVDHRFWESNAFCNPCCVKWIRTVDPSCLPSALRQQHLVQPMLCQVDPNDGSKLFTIGSGTAALFLNRQCGKWIRTWIQAFHHRFWDNTAFLNSADPSGSEPGSKLFTIGFGITRLFSTVRIQVDPNLDPSSSPSVLG